MIVIRQKHIWRCEFYRKGCCARVHTPYELDMPKIIFRVAKHNHPACVAKTDALKAICTMRENIRTHTTISTREVLATTLESTNEDTRYQLPSIPVLSYVTQDK